MGIFSQCLGITGGILLFYGLVTVAWTQAASWFLWTLLISGAAFLLVFFVTALNRTWQSLITLFVALNVPWLILVFGKEWPTWALGAGAGLCVVIFFFISRKQAALSILLPICAVVAGSFAGLLFLKEKSWYGYAILSAACLYNGTVFYLGRLFLREMFQKRSMRYGTTAVVYSIIMVTALVVANVASQDFHAQKDFTENKVNLLTDQSEKVLSNLKSPLTITGFFDDRNQTKAAVKDLFNMYRVKSKKVEINFVDPDKNKILAEKHSAKDGDILLEYEGKNTIIQTPSEQGITQAILKVTRTTSPNICFTKGHGELELVATEEAPRGLSAVKTGLENEGYKSKEIDSIVGGISEDCSIVVVAGPTQQFTKGEASVLDQFLEDGGKALFMLDPNIPDARLIGSNTKITVLDTGLEDLMKKWGVELGKNFILEKHLKLLQGVQVEFKVLAQTYGNHPIVDPLKGKQTVFDGVRSLQKASGFSGTTYDLISSGGHGASWAQSDIDTLFRSGKVVPSPKDIQGPVPIAMASEREGKDKKKTQLVVFGDSDFAANAMVRSFEFNFDTVLNSLNWLSGSVEQISIRPKQMRTSTIDLTPEQTNMIFYVAIVAIPMLVLIFGMNLWWYRKRRG